MICASHRNLAGHQPPAGHPEHPHRITYIWEDLEGLFGKGMVSEIHRQATREELCLAHSPEYIDYLFSLRGTSAQLDGETFFSEQSLEAILTASGICLELMERIVRGTCLKGFALIRPPGHHAGYNRARGYCIINNMAVAVRKALLLNIKRIAVIDWDVHHGNGTQELFEETDAVFFMDLHQANLFPPHSGAAEERGKNQGVGFTLNIPLPPGSTGSLYLSYMDTVMYPLLKAYKPQLICVSSGFDALAGDLEGAMELTPRDFGLMTQKVCSWAEEFCGGKVFMTLEGGYRVENLSPALGECIKAMHHGGVYGVEPPWETFLPDPIDPGIHKKTAQFIENCNPTDKTEVQDFFKITFSPKESKDPYFEYAPHQRWRKFLLSVYYADLLSYSKKEDQADFSRLWYILSKFPEGFTVWWIRSQDQCCPVGYTGWYYVEESVFNQAASLQDTHRFFLPAQEKTPYLYLFNYSIAPLLNHSAYSRILIKDYVSALSQIPYEGLFCAAVSEDGGRVAERFGMKVIGTIGGGDRIYGWSKNHALV